MTNDDLSVAIADAINGLCERYSQGDSVMHLNAMANCLNFCITSLVLNVDAERVLEMMCRMHREAETTLLMREMGAPGYDAK